MGKIRDNSSAVNEIVFKEFVRASMRKYFHEAFTESKPTEEKPYGILASDWYHMFDEEKAFGIPCESKRGFRHYKSRKDRDKALVDLRKHYPHVEFTIPPWEESVLHRLGIEEEKPSVYVKVTSFIRRCFRGWV